MSDERAPSFFAFGVHVHVCNTHIYMSCTIGKPLQVKIREASTHMPALDYEAGPSLKSYFPGITLRSLAYITVGGNIQFSVPIP